LSLLEYLVTYILQVWRDMTSGLLELRQPERFSSGDWHGLGCPPFLCWNVGSDDVDWDANTSQRDDPIPHQWLLEAMPSEHASIQDFACVCDAFNLSTSSIGTRLCGTSVDYPK